MNNSNGDDAASVSQAGVDPFGAQLASPEYCSSPQLEQRSELVQHLVEYSNQVILIIGEPGIGKTAFADNLVLRAPQAWRIAQISARPEHTPQDLIAVISHDFDLSPPAEQDVGAQITNVQQGATALENADLTPLVIVDDAHELTLEALAVLLQLAQSETGAGRLHVLMLCRSDITKLFGSAELQRYQSDIVHHLDIPPLDQERIAVFLADRLAAAGIESKFDDATVAEIHAASNGVPAAVLSQASEAFARASKGPESRAGGRSRFTLPAPRAIGIAVALVITVLLVTWLSGRETKMPPADPVLVQLPAIDHGETASSPEVNPPLEPLPALQPMEESLPEPVVAVDEPVTTESVPADEGADAVSDAASTPVPVVPLVAEPAPVAPEPVIEAPTATAVATPPPTPAARPLLGVRDSAWFKRQQPQQYVLQLFGVHDRAAVLTYLQKSADPTPLSWFVTTFNDRPWYVVCFGLYPDRDSARAAAPGLAQEYRRYSPWARSIGDIQTQMIAP